MGKTPEVQVKSGEVNISLQVSQRVDSFMKVYSAIVAWRCNHVLDDITELDELLQNLKKQIFLVHNNYSFEKGDSSDSEKTPDSINLLVSVKTTSLTLSLL